MLKKFISMVVALALVLMAVPCATVSFAAETDYFAYDFNDYSGANTFTVGEGTLAQWKLIAESSIGIGRASSNLGGIGGKEASDICLKFSVSETSSDKSAVLGPWTNPGATSIKDDYFSSTKPVVTYQWDVYDTTANGSFTVFGRKDATFSGSNHYTFGGITVGKNEWHTIAAEFIRVGSTNNACNIYVDGKKTAAYTNQSYDYPRYCYLYLNATAADSGIMAVDNMRVYDHFYEGYEGATELYSYNFDDAVPSYLFAKFEAGSDNASTRGNAHGFMGKADDDRTLTFTFDGTEADGKPYLYYKTGISKYEGVITYELSYCDTTSKSYHRVDPLYNDEKWGPALEYTYAAGNNFSFKVGAKTLVGEDGWSIKKPRDGYWHEIAVTYDTDNDYIVYYLDGEELDRETIDGLNTTEKFKWTITHSSGDPGVVSFDDFRVYKGAYNAAENRAAITSSDEMVKIDNKTINIFSASEISLAQLQGKISATGDIALYENRAALESGITTDGAVLADDNILVTKSSNGEQLAYYTLNVVESDSTVSVGTPVIKYDVLSQTLKAEADIINYSDTPMNIGIYLAVYSSNGTIKSIEYVALDSRAVSGEATLRASIDDIPDTLITDSNVKVKAMVWNSETLKPITDSVETYTIVG